MIRIALPVVSLGHDILKSVVESINGRCVKAYVYVREG